MIVLNEHSTNQPISFLASGELGLQPAQALKVIGMGRLFKSGPLSTLLLEVEGDFVPTPDCNAAYNPLTGVNPIDDSMICAGKPGKGVCSGDKIGRASCRERV